jgi:hypothetical protein
VILLTRLCGGQRATVLQLPAAPRPREDHDYTSRKHPCQF